MLTMNAGSPPVGPPPVVDGGEELPRPPMPHAFVEEDGSISWPTVPASQLLEGWLSWLFSTTTPPGTPPVEVSDDSTASAALEKSLQLITLDKKAEDPKEPSPSPSASSSAPPESRAPPLQAPALAPGQQQQPVGGPQRRRWKSRVNHRQRNPSGPGPNGWAWNTNQVHEQRPSMGPHPHQGYPNGLGPNLWAWSPSQVHAHEQWPPYWGPNMAFGPPPPPLGPPLPPPPPRLNTGLGPPLLPPPPPPYMPIPDLLNPYAYANEFQPRLYRPDSNVPNFIVPYQYRMPMYYPVSSSAPPMPAAAAAPPPPVAQQEAPPSSVLLQKLRTQIEYYFSDENLEIRPDHNDQYLKSLMDREGWVSIHEVATFRRVVSLTINLQPSRRISVIQEALRPSVTVELQGEKLRKRDGWQKYLPES